MKNKTKKLLVVISSPLFTLSGYGKHSYDIVNSLYKSYKDEWDIRLISNKWGSCSMVEDVNDELAALILREPLTTQPDIWIQITVPNEFQPVGKYNIGITAGIETTACSGKWIEGLNKMDYILVPSKHAKTVLESTTYTKFDQQGNNLGELKCEKPIDIIFEGVDLTYFKHISENQMKSKDLIYLESYINNVIKEDFNFLIVSQWGHGEIFHDRKDVGGAIVSFYKAFKDKKTQPGLILKINGAAYSHIDKENMLKHINHIREIDEFKDCKLPNIYIIYGQLSTEELNMLYNHKKVKAMFSLTKGEGYSRTFPEFLAASGKPLLTTYFSGHLDYLDINFVPLISGELKELHPTVIWEDILIKESKWLYVDYNAVSIYLKDIYNDYDSYLLKSNKLAEIIRDKWSLDEMNIKLKSIFDIFIENHYIKPVEIIDLVVPDLDEITKEISIT